LRDQAREAVVSGDFERLEEILVGEPRVVRHLIGLMYVLDENVRGNCTQALVLAARHYPKLVERVIKSLVWSMDQRSGTFAPSAPEVLKAIAEEKPELLVPVMPDLVRLAGDTSLGEGLSDTLRVVAEKFPGELGRRLAKSLDSRLKYGDQIDIATRR
jgi:hypothetical protein